MPLIEELDEKIKQLQQAVEEQRRKHWTEIVVIPLTIAVTGALSTYFITDTQLKSAQNVAKSDRDNTMQIAAAQIENAKTISDSNIEVGRQRAVSDQRLKALELHIKYIADSNPKIRQTGVRLLAVIEPDLASKLRDEVIAQDKDEGVRQAAKSVEISGWFPVVFSIRDRTEAIEKARSLNNGTRDYLAELYKATDDKGKLVYAVTLGGYLSQVETLRRVAYAKQRIAPDAYAWASSTWGKNLLDEIAQPLDAANKTQPLRR